MGKESTEESFVVIESERNLNIQHRSFGMEGKRSSWDVQPVDDNYLIVSKSQVPFGSGDGYAFLPVGMFKDVLAGLCASRWSGVVKVDSSGYLKKIFFRDGKLCFASSSLIDDRLGEKLYRSGRISIDELVDSASRVDRSHKFGQVLLRSSVINTVELWEALKEQVLEIFRSVFIPGFTKFVLEQGQHKAFMEVVYPQSTLDIIDECFSYASMLREFGRTLPATASLSVVRNHHKPGTFIGDMIELIQKTGTVEQFLMQSKLRKHNTISVLLDLVNQGVCKIGEANQQTATLKEISSELNSKADLYGLLLKKVKDGFEANGVEVPLSDLRQFALRINVDGDTAFALDEHGQIDHNCRRNIHSQCKENHRRVQYFVGLIESVTHFLMQLTIDLGPSSIVDDVRKTYREMS